MNRTNLTFSPPRLFTKAFLSISALVFCLLLAIYITAIPLVESVVRSAEERSGLTAIDNVVKLVEMADEDVKQYRLAMVDERKKELKDILTLTEETLRNNYKKALSAGNGKKASLNLALTGLRKFRYGNDDYVFAYNSAAMVVAHPDPKLDNTDFSQLHDLKGKLFLPQMIKLGLENGDGYCSYWWNRLDHKSASEKLTYVRYLPDLDLHLATGLYIDDIEELVAKRKSALMLNLAERIKTIRIGREGYIYVFDGKYTMLFHPNMAGTNTSKIRDPSTNKLLTDELIQAANKAEGFRYLWDKPGDEKHFVYRKISWVRHFPAYDWYIVSSIYLDDLYESANVLKKRLFLVGSIGLVISLALAFLFIRKFTRPIVQLAEIAHKVEAGDYNASSSVQRNDEIGDLALAFNSMVAQLRDHIQNLDDKILTRTREMQEAKEVAVAANKAKSSFLANMSHEIRTPMNAVLGFAQLLMRDNSLSPSARDKVETILKSGDHLLSIINEILEMSRIEAGRIELNITSVDLFELLDDLSVMFKMRATEKELVFNLESDPNLPRYIMTDLGKLRQILINLLGNAVKFTNEGSISLRAFPTGIDQIAIEVQDTGIGIPEEEQENLFHPFVRAKDGQHAGGTGLGLAISREYAHLIDGEITVTSNPDRGSCFQLEFIAPVSARQPDLLVPHPKSYIGLAPGQGDIRILIVDDQNINRLLLHGILEPLGFIVDEAHNGMEAIDKVATFNPHIVLMDSVMPGINGGETTRILRERYDKGSLIIIGITASTLEDEKKQFLDTGLNAFVAKPFREQELFDLMTEHAGILFETKEEEYSVISAVQRPQLLPSVDKMSAEWREAFCNALASGSFAHIRMLGEAAEATDPFLADWICKRSALNDLEGLSKLTLC